MPFSLLPSNFLSPSLLPPLSLPSSFLPPLPPPPPQEVRVDNGEAATDVAVRWGSWRAILSLLWCRWRKLVCSNRPKLLWIVYSKCRCAMVQPTCKHAGCTRAFTIHVTKVWWSTLRSAAHKKTDNIMFDVVFKTTAFVWCLTTVPLLDFYLATCLRCTLFQENKPVYRVFFPSPSGIGAKN